MYLDSVLAHDAVEHGVHVALGALRGWAARAVCQALSHVIYNPVPPTLHATGVVHPSLWQSGADFILLLSATEPVRPNTRPEVHQLYFREGVCGRAQERLAHCPHAVRQALA